MLEARAELTAATASGKGPLLLMGLFAEEHGRPPIARS